MPISGNRGPIDNGPTIQESIRDAQSRPLDFPAKERALYIRAMIERTRDFLAAGRSVEDIKTLLPEFARDYPHLFETATGPDFDPSTLQTMLAMLDRMGDGSLNHHQASVIVGKRLAQKYIRPDGQS